nr:HNH endonuclease domain-containing protein [Nodosilinea sp. TSF1-S3]
MPTRRDSLSKQTDYWKLVLRSQPLRYIYSQQVIDPNRFSLDHYLPWSFVAHDQLWNLVPTLPEVNSAKSNNLPSNKYFAQFVTLQHCGLVATRKALSAGKWERQIDPFISDLGVSTMDELLDVQRLGNAYEQVVKPLLPLAVNQGFCVG